MEAITGAESSFEKYLCDRASMTNTPIGGNFELIPACNMNCRMCYVRMPMDEVNRLGGVRPAEFWIHLGEQLKEQGTLFILLTGGEPLLYPYFKEVYTALHEMGFVISINTNGTLITEEIADLFRKHQPRKLNITIYGKDDETYGLLCANPKGFTQLMRGIHLLMERDITFKFNCSLTPYNIDQLYDIRAIAERLDVFLEMGYYMFPPNRKTGITDYDKNRLTPEQAAEAAFVVETYRYTEESVGRFIASKLNAVRTFDPSTKKLPGGFWCRAANASFWVNWNGTMSACGMLKGPVFDLNEHTFKEQWDQMRETMDQIHLAEECLKCDKQSLCIHCGSAEAAENGEYGKKIDYLCRFSEAYYRILEREEKNYAVL